MADNPVWVRRCKQILPVLLSSLVLAGTACSEAIMKNENENGNVPGTAAAVEHLEAKATALAPSLTGTRGVSGWTGVAQIGAELVFEQVAEPSEAAIAARAEGGEVRSAPLTDRSADSIQGAFAAAGATDPDDTGALAQLAGTVADFLTGQGTATAYGFSVGTQTRRKAGVGIDLGDGAGSVLVYRRFTALTAHSR